MKLDITDLARLYGSQIFLVEGEEEIVNPEEKKNEVKSSSDSIETEKKVEAKAETPKEEVISEPKQIPEPETPKVQAIEIPATLTKGSQVAWKLKAQASMAFVMDANEFKDRSLTGFLKQCIDAAAVDTAKVGFGVINSAAGEWNFSELPVEKVWVFGTSSPFFPNPFVIGGKNLFVYEKLATVINHPEQKAHFIQQLKNQ